MEKQVNSRRSRPIVTAVLTLAVIFGGCGIVIALADSGVRLSSHSGPAKLFSLGFVRMQSCAYQGSFVGGAGYDCVVRNLSASDPRGVGNMHCAGFDAAERLLGAPQLTADLYGAVMGPGEERVVRLYFPEKAEVGVCSETGDVLAPTRIRSMLDELKRNNLEGELDL